MRANKSLSKIKFPTSQVVHFMHLLDHELLYKYHIKPGAHSTFERVRSGSVYTGLNSHCAVLYRLCFVQVPHISTCMVHVTNTVCHIKRFTHHKALLFVLHIL